MNIRFFPVFLEMRNRIGIRQNDEGETPRLTFYSPSVLFFIAVEPIPITGFNLVSELPRGKS